MTGTRRGCAPRARSKIVIIGLNYAPETTGIAPYTTGFARHLASEGHDVTVVAGHPHYPEWTLHPGYEKKRDSEIDRGVRLLRVRHPVPRNPTGPARVWMEVVYAWRAGVRLLRERPNVVVAVSPALLSLVPALLLRRPLGFRLGAVVQDLYGAALSETEIGGGLASRATAKLEALLLRRTDGVVVIHDIFRKRLVATGLAEEQITVIPNWAHVSMPEDQDRAAMRERLGWREDEFIAVHAGNMGAKQGLEGLVDVARLAERQGSKVRIVFVGNGSRRAALVDYARGADRASFMTSLPEGEFESALSASDCLLLHEKPGVMEMSVPSKLTTYFTVGRPVVAATDPHSGAASLMQQAGAGPIVEAGNPEAILKSIESLMEDPKGAATFGAQGRAYAAKHLTGNSSLRREAEWLRALAG